MGMAVRRAVTGDVEWLLRELKDFAEFVNAPVSLIEDDNYARAQLRVLIEQHFFIVAEQRCEITGALVPVGFLSALEVPHPFNPKRKLASEQFWWVTPEARGSRAGAMLLAAYRERAHQIHLEGGIATIALEANSPIKQSSLEKRGFRLVERSFVYDPQPQGVA